MNERETENLLRQIRELSIQDKKTVADIVDQLTVPSTSIPINTNQSTNRRYVTADGIKLEIGDKVQILNNRKTGRIGDTARITKFNKKFVALELEKNKSCTQRDSKNIIFIERAK